MNRLDSLVRRLRGGPRHRNDASAARDVNWRHFANDLPSGLSLEWLGTAGFRIAYEGVALLVDPYFTRYSLRHALARGPLLPAQGVLSRHLDRVDAVLVGHTHFDHALDVPWIAKRYDCPVYGSGSLRTLMALYGLADRAVEAPLHRPVTIGPFTVSFTPSLHSMLLLGLKVPADGELTCDCLDDLGTNAYRCGPVYGIHIEVAGRSFYHQGSANLIEDEIRVRGVDYFLCGIAGRVFTPRYVARVLRRLEPRIIVPQHFDDFFRPLDAPMGFSFNVNFGGFLDEVAAVSRDFEVRALEPLQRIVGTAAAARRS